MYDVPIVNMDLFEDLTGEIDTKKETPVIKIGDRIKKLREEKNISIETLSQITGFDVEILSGIESNKLKPQIGTTLKLSKALESAFGKIISDKNENIVSITRKDERKPIIRSTSAKGTKNIYSYKSLANVNGRHMEPLTVLLEESPDAELSVHNGEEFIFVLNGIATLKIGNDVYELNPGDSAYYLSTTPHLLSAKEDQATILAVVFEG